MRVKWIVAVVFITLSLASIGSYATVRTAGTYVTIPAMIEIQIDKIPISFPSTYPGGEFNASSGYGFPMVINVTDNTNVNVTICMKGEGDFESSSNTFNITNLSYSNTSNGKRKLMTLSYNETDPFLDWYNIPPPPPGENRTVYAYFWVKIPWGQPAGIYTTNISVRANQTQ